MTTWNIGSAAITRVEEQLGITNQPAINTFATSNVTFWSATSIGSRPIITASSTTGS